jgi:hypothetical protein
VIPDLAMIVSAYVVFRMIEVWLFPASRYGSKGARVAACILALLVILATGLMVLDIVTRGPAPSATP